MNNRPKRTVKPPQTLKEYVVITEVDEEEPLDFQNVKFRPQESKSTFKCKKCNLICKNKNEILSHLKRHKGKENFVCEECGKTLSSLQSFTEHSHIHKNIKPYRCDVCGHESRQFSVHSRHLLKHEDNPEKLFRCTVCSKAFKQKYYLKQHVRKHVGEKPYECGKCMKRFTTKSELNRHAISHSSARPFFCQFCNKKFKLRHNLLAHVRAHTKGQVWKCSLCKAKFPQQYLMEKHKKTHTQVVQHLELIKHDPQSLSITTRPLDRRKVLHHQKMALPSKLDLNDSDNTANSKMLLGLNDAFIPLSFIASSFGTGNYIRMKIVDRINLNDKHASRNLSLNGVGKAVLVEEEVATKSEELEQGLMTVQEINHTENPEITEIINTENQLDIGEKISCQFETFENVFQNNDAVDKQVSWLQTMADLVKDLTFPVDKSVCHQLHTIIIKVQTILVNSIQDVKLNNYAMDLHAPSCRSCPSSYIQDGVKNDVKSSKANNNNTNNLKRDDKNSTIVNSDGLEITEVQDDDLKPIQVNANIKSPKASDIINIGTTLIKSEELPSKIHDNLKSKTESDADLGDDQRPNNVKYKDIQSNVASKENSKSNKTKINNLKPRKVKLKVELCNQESESDSVRKGRIKEMFHCYSILIDCLYKQFCATLDI